VTRRSRNSRWEGGLVLVDPSIDGSDLNELAGDLGRLVVLVPATAPLPRVPRWLPASPLIMPTSTRYGEEGNRSTRVWIKTGSPDPTSPTWSRPGTHPDELRRQRAQGRHPLVARHLPIRHLGTPRASPRL